LTLAFFPSAAPAAAPAATSRASIVAQARGSSVEVFATPKAKRPLHVLANPIASGAPLVFLVRQRVPGWTQVHLPIRPNGSLGWVRTRSVMLALDPYRLTVSLSRHRITLWKDGKAIIEQRAGVGRSVLPTPTGLYYIVELLRQPDPRGPYGPYAFGLSAHSNVLYSFGGGPGQIGIHGTNEPGLLGTSVSHGCIRVVNSLIAKLARILPLGTPVAINP
jgi:lipoprotein-anchoring transpeptidase ErfK/SrfK